MAMTAEGSARTKAAWTGGPNGRHPAVRPARAPLACGRGANLMRQIVLQLPHRVRAARLGQNIHRAALQCLESDVAGSLPQRTDHHYRHGMEPHQLFEESEAVHARHLDIQGQHVGAQSSGSCRARRTDPAPFPPPRCPASAASASASSLRTIAESSTINTLIFRSSGMEFPRPKFVLAYSLLASPMETATMPSGRLKQQCMASSEAVPGAGQFRSAQRQVRLRPQRAHQCSAQDVGQFDDYFP